MKTALLNTMKLGVLAFAGVAAVAGMTGCGGGSQTRTADQWQQEVGKEIDGKTADLRACYRQSNTQARVATTSLTITGTPSDDATATLSVSRASVDPGSSALDECVTKALAGLPLPAGDSNIGDGTWKVTFDPAQLDPTAPVPPAAPAAAPPPSPTPKS